MCLAKVWAVLAWDGGWRTALQ